MDERPLKDSDWIYRGYSVPWLSEDEIHIEIYGFGFLNVFDQLYSPESPHQEIGNIHGFEFVAYWNPLFPGWNAIGLLVFRKRVERV
jgi:hypothetical protein